MKTNSKSDMRNEAESICGCVHTPGPWERHTHAYSDTIQSVGGSCVCSLIDGIDKTANARLIASAPELLAALESIAALEPSIMSKQAEEGFRYHTDEDAYRIHLAGLINRARAFARAAIAKARG